METRELLIEQFNSCFNENGWFVALRNVISDVSSEQTEWKPEGADNSIREIINHLNYYNYAYLQRFAGREYEYKLADNDATFDEGEGRSWLAEAKRFEMIMAEWSVLLNASNETKLDKLAPPLNETSWRTIIANINLHNAHHGGQILLLRKLQGAWNSENGVS